MARSPDGVTEQKTPMFFRHSNPAHRRQRLVMAQRWLAMLFLIAVVALCVVDPIVECHDHFDNLRHMGPGSLLTVTLLFACAGTLLFLTVRVLRILLLRYAAVLEGVCTRISRMAAMAPLLFPPGTLPLALRI
jgi:hypothetical protein